MASGWMIAAAGEVSAEGLVPTKQVTTCLLMHWTGGAGTGVTCVSARSTQAVLGAAAEPGLC